MATSVLILTQKAEVKVAKLTVENEVNLEHIQKYFKKKTEVEILGSYNYKSITLFLFGFTKGKAGTENKHELPPPHDTTVAFGDIMLIASKNERSFANPVPFKVEDYELFYSRAFGGEDIDDLDDEDDEDDLVEEEEVDDVEIEEEIVEDDIDDENHEQNSYVSDEDEEEIVIIKKDKKIDLLDEEIGAAERIKSAISSESITVFNTIGCSLCESINWSLLCGFFVAPWGAGLAKYKWIANKPGLVFSSTKVLNSRSDLHIYDSPIFREATYPCEYIDSNSVIDIDEILSNFNLVINDLYDKIKILAEKYGSLRHRIHTID